MKPLKKAIPGDTPAEKETHLVQAFEATEEFLRWAAITHRIRAKLHPDEMTWIQSRAGTTKSSRSTCETCVLI